MTIDDERPGTMRTTKKSTETLIMSAAMEVFSTGDFEKATMRSIAEKAAVPTSSIYKYFKNKDDLYITLISTIIDRTNKELNMHLAGLSSTKVKIRKMIQFHFNFFQNNLHIARLIFASTNIGYWYEYRGAYEKARESASVLARIIHEGQRSGEVRADINLHVVNHIYFGALRAIVVNWLFRHDDYKLSDMSEYFADVIYDGINSKIADKTSFECPFMSREK
jgi:AcrR family transcriptional regulator